MPKYLFHGSYTPEGLKGLLAEGGSKRREAAQQALKSAGGTLEAFYFAFGDDDFVIITDGGDNCPGPELVDGIRGNKLNC